MKTADAARGKWLGILTHFGVDENCLSGKHQPCPICGGGRDRFRFDNKDGTGSFICSQCGSGQGLTLLMKLKGWDFATAAAEVDRMVGNVTEQIQPTKSDPAIRLNRTTSALRPISNAVRSYLSNRGLKPCKGIHSAEMAYYDDGKRLDDYSCMVCPIQNASGDLISYHITYLQDGKKANVPSPKKMLPPTENTSGAAIRLTAIYPTIGLAEGIETALAVMEIYKMPCWAASNAHMMESFKPPEGITGVLIYSDFDQNFAGQKAAYALANRLAIQGYTTGVFLPTKPGDFADAIKPVTEGEPA